MCEDQVGQPTSTNDKGEVSVARLARLALITDWYRNLCPARGFGRSLAGDSSGKVECGAPPSSPYLPYFFFYLPLSCRPLLLLLSLPLLALLALLCNLLF